MQQTFFEIKEEDILNNQPPDCVNDSLKIHKIMG